MLPVSLIEKRTFEGLPNLMKEVARDEMSRLSEEIPECKVSYIPEVRTTFYLFKRFLANLFVLKCYFTV